MFYIVDKVPRVNREEFFRKLLSGKFRIIRFEIGTYIPSDCSEDIIYEYEYEGEYDYIPLPSGGFVIISGFGSIEMIRVKIRLPLTLHHELYKVCIDCICGCDYYEHYPVTIYDGYCFHARVKDGYYEGITFELFDEPISDVPVAPFCNICDSCYTIDDEPPIPGMFWYGFPMLFTEFWWCDNPFTWTQRAGNAYYYPNYYPYYFHYYCTPYFPYCPDIENERAPLILHCLYDEEDEELKYCSLMSLCLPAEYGLFYIDEDREYDLIWCFFLRHIDEFSDFISETRNKCHDFCLKYGCDSDPPDFDGCIFVG